MNKYWELRLSAIFKQNGKPRIGQDENDDPTIYWHSWSFPLASQKASCDAGKDLGPQAYPPIEPLPRPAQVSSAKPPWHIHPSFSQLWDWKIFNAHISRLPWQVNYSSYTVCSISSINGSNKCRDFYKYAAIKWLERVKYCNSQF